MVKGGILPDFRATGFTRRLEVHDLVVPTTGDVSPRHNGDPVTKLSRGYEVTGSKSSRGFCPGPRIGCTTHILRISGLSLGLNASCAGYPRMALITSSTLATHAIRGAYRNFKSTFYHRAPRELTTAPGTRSPPASRPGRVGSEEAQARPGSGRGRQRAGPSHGGIRVSTKLGGEWISRGLD